MATELGYPVVSIPGPNAAISALIASGLVPQPFLFHGFLSREKSDAKKELATYHGVPATLILYEAPHRLKNTIGICLEALGNRRATLARELTKKHEHFLRGDLEGLLEWSIQNEVRGECCLIIAPLTAEEVRHLENENCIWKNWSIVEHMQHYINQGETEKESMRLVAKDRDLRKRDVYQVWLDEKNQANQ